MEVDLEPDYFIVQFYVQHSTYLLTSWKLYGTADNTLEDVSRLMRGFRRLDGYAGLVADHPLIKKFVAKRDNPSYTVTKEMLVGRNPFAHTAIIIGPGGMPIGKLNPGTWGPVKELDIYDWPPKAKYKTKTKRLCAAMLDDLTHSVPNKATKRVKASKPNSSQREKNKAKPKSTPAKKNLSLIHI